MRAVALRGLMAICTVFCIMAHSPQVDFRAKCFQISNGNWKRCSFANTGLKTAVQKGMGVYSAASAQTVFSQNNDSQELWKTELFWTSCP